MATVSKKITILAELNILAGFETTVLENAEKVWVETRRESGCEAFLLNTKDKNTIVFFEVFKSEEDFEFHKKAKHTADFLASLAGKVVGDGPHLTFLNQFID